jgi:hypothetical protein
MNWKVEIDNIRSTCIVSCSSIISISDTLPYTIHDITAIHFIEVTTNHRLFTDSHSCVTLADRFLSISFDCWYWWSLTSYVYHVIPRILRSYRIIDEIGSMQSIVLYTCRNLCSWMKPFKHDILRYIKLIVIENCSKLVLFSTYCVYTMRFNTVLPVNRTTIDLPFMI